MGTQHSSFNQKTCTKQPNKTGGELEPDMWVPAFNKQSQSTDKPREPKSSATARVGRKLRRCFTALRRWRGSTDDQTKDACYAVDEISSVDSGHGSEETFDDTPNSSNASSPRGYVPVNQDVPTTESTQREYSCDKGFKASSRLSSRTLDSGFGSLSSVRRKKSDKKKRVSIILPQKKTDVALVRKVTVTSRTVIEPRYSVKDSVETILKNAEKSLIDQHPSIAETIHLIFSSNPAPVLKQLSSDQICALLFDARQLLFSSCAEDNQHFQVFLFVFQKFLLVVFEIVGDIVDPVDSGLRHLPGDLNATRSLYLHLWTSLLNLF